MASSSQMPETLTEALSPSAQISFILIFWFNYEPGLFAI